MELPKCNSTPSYIIIYISGLPCHTEIIFTILKSLWIGLSNEVCYKLVEQTICEKYKLTFCHIFLADSNYYTLCMFKQCIEMSFLLLCNTKRRSTGICLFSFALTCTTKKIIFLEHCLLVGISWLKYHRNLEIAKNWSW